MENQQADQKKFKDLVTDIKFCMMVTRTNPDQQLRGRPMTTASIDDDGALWFFTNEYSGKVDEVSENNEVFLSYASPSDNSYLCVNGTAEPVDDRNKMKELWKPAYKAWFSDGLDDPKLFLLKVKPSEAEYWDSTNSKIVMAIGFIKSVVTGKEYDGGEHGRIKV